MDNPTLLGIVSAIATVLVAAIRAYVEIRRLEKAQNLEELDRTPAPSADRPSQLPRRVLRRPKSN